MHQRHMWWLSWALDSCSIVVWYMVHPSHVTIIRDMPSPMLMGVSAIMAIACAGAAAGAAQEGVFNLKGLWDSLPFGLFLQACGSAASRDAVSALDPETDKAMGKLPPRTSPQ